MNADLRNPTAIRGDSAPRWLALAVGVAGALLYLVRLYPDVGWYDSGELSGVAAGLGIAHPTGYPLYSLAGRLALTP